MLDFSVYIEQNIKKYNNIIGIMRSLWICLSRIRLKNIENRKVNK